MFTGLVEATVVVRAVRKNPGGDGALRLEIENPWNGGHTVPPSAGEGAAWGRQDPALGDSVAVNGCCLTRVDGGAGGGDILAFEAGPATLARTTLADFRVGRPVHLERALCFGDRLGGHLVSGHVDGQGELVARREEMGSLHVGFRVPPAVRELSAPQGSITLDGVSLTITELEGDLVWICLIPHTLQVTHLGALRPGDRVNCEADLLARYVKRLSQPAFAAHGRRAEGMPHAL